MKTKSLPAFAREARRLLDLPVAHRVNALGGYGPDGEVIYEAHPPGCPSVLVDSRGGAKATFMSNGSIEFQAETCEGLEIRVLEASFDGVEKRETGMPAGNVWLALPAGRGRRVASLVNPSANDGLPAARMRVVKQGDPGRAMAYGAVFRAPGGAVETVVRHSLAITPAGPAVVRQVCVRNAGRRRLAADLWTYFHPRGTQRFVYNKPLWYDNGLPLSPLEIVVAATVPYSEMVQLKRVSTAARNARPVEATCDYGAFVGDTSATALLPAAVRRGALLPGAGAQLNRFTTPTIAASRFALSLAPGAAAVVEQSLLYVTDPAARADFRRLWASELPTYRAQAAAFRRAGRDLVRRTPGAARVCRPAAAAVARSDPAFEVDIPNDPAVSRYANSVWTGVKELYENCRAHGARLADGVELGTRDRAQDMWPKIKEDPGRVRADLVHAFGFMYVTGDEPPAAGGAPLTLRQKLHGMYPRQYPSCWRDRTVAVRNDNRPYTDSPLWFVNALYYYLRETGDLGILAETVTTVRLTDPDNPIQSGIVGSDRTQTVLQAVFEILACFERHVNDSPYGLAQVLYGDWCDPVDMFGTSVVGDGATRGRGRGGHVRLSAHLFLCLIEIADLCRSRPVQMLLQAQGLSGRVEGLQRLADRLRANVVRVAWEDGDGDFHAGFVNAIHELRADGSRPDYARGETGYTLGSMRGRDFDGLARRDLGGLSYPLAMLQTKRDYLTPVAGVDGMVRRLLRTTDALMFRGKLGLLLFSTPVGNNEQARRLAGRMGVVPSGCAENGEYHHGQIFMHRFRLDVPGETDNAWRQLKPILSAMRDEGLAGPFETPSTSYTSDPDDPHFGKGMYFGLSGSVDWFVEILHRLAGLRLALHDPDKPAVRVEPNLPASLRDAFTLRRLIHVAQARGGYRVVPLEIAIRREGDGASLRATRVTINGRPAPKAEVATLDGVDRLTIGIVRVY